MAYIPQQQYTGSYTPTTQPFDPSEIYEVDVNSEDFKKLIVSLYQYTNLLALVLSTKDSGYYMTQEFVNSQLFFNPASNNPNDNRSVFRKVINFGALPSVAGVPGQKSVAHGITCTANTSFTRIYGCSTDPAGFNYIPLPYASPTLANNIELKVDATNVTVITGSNRSAFTITYIILEYLQN